MATPPPLQTIDFDDIDLDLLRRRRSAKWTTYPADVLPAWVAELDVLLAEPIRRALHDAVDLGDTGYAMPGALPEAFAGFAANRLSWAVDPAHVVVVPDVMTGIEDLLRVATAPGDGVVINPPVYQPFFVRLAELGRKAVEVPLLRSAEGWDLDLDGLAAAFGAGTRVFLLCSPHNPLGRVWSVETLRGVAELAHRHGVLVLADEIHGPLALPGAVHTPYISLGGAAAAHGVVFTAASKAWNLPGLKCALAVAGGDLGRKLLGRLPDQYVDRAGLMGVAASVAAYTQGQEWLDALLSHLDRNRRLAADLLVEWLPDIGYRPPEASYLAWLDCTRLGLGDDPAAEFLRRGRVALSSGPGFGRPGAGFARLNLGTSRELLTEAVRRMASAIG